MSANPLSPALVVVMPTRNQAPFLAAAVHSVVAEGLVDALVVQDGASTDGTADLLAALARQHPSLDIVSEADSGPADALNRALRRALARGAGMIGWLNSDDLYTPGAIGRALAHFEAHPGHVAVYGEGEHIDADERRIGAYPTQRPEGPLSNWRDGCPICQPTMFLRRSAVEALLPVDESLRAAFDYELWLRLFKAFPGRIGFIPALQARSRLHAGGITLSQRERVALEAMQVVHRHLGPAPAHWLVTHAAEALAACPFEAETLAVKQHLLALADQAAPWLAAGGVDGLKQAMQASRAWQLAQAQLGLDVAADGWAGPALTLRLRQAPDPAAAIGRLRVHGRHAWPRPQRLRQQVTAWHQGQALAAARAWWRQRFVLEIPVPARPPGERLEITLQAAHSFVPAELLPSSHDVRRLAWQVEAIEALPAAPARRG